MLFNIFFPWIFSLTIMLPTFLELTPTFGTFGYNPTTGECNIINGKVFSVIEILGTYIPFICMVMSYAWIASTVWKRQAFLRSTSEHNM